MSSLGNKRVELFDMGGGASDPTADDNVQVASGEIRTIFVYAYVIWITYSFHQDSHVCYN